VKSYRRDLTIILGLTPDVKGIQRLSSSAVRQLPNNIAGTMKE